MPYFGIPIRNGLPIGLGSVAGFGIAPFSPESLFENGEQGAWYDPTDVNINWRRNLLTYTEEFDQGVWTKPGLNAFGSGSVANTTATTDPLGGNTADFIQEDNTPNIHGVQAFSALASAITNTFSVYVKASTRSWVALRVDGVNSYFDLSNGQKGTIGSGVTADIFPVGNGWYRCAVTKTWIANNNVWVRIATGDGVDNYTGDGTSGIYIWGAQLEQASTATAYQQIITPEITYLQTIQPQPVLFTDSAGTTPVTGVEQFVGLMLDKSKGLVLGSELATGILGSTSGWTFVGAANVTGGAIVFNTPPSTNASAQYNPIVASGKWYQSTITITGTGQVVVQLGSAGTTVTLVAPGTYTFRGLASGGTPTVLTFSSVLSGVNNFVGSVTAISVRELPGNHAFQTSSAKRPKLAARYNLLTYSEEFQNAAWTKAQSTISANTTATTDPLGGTTADKLIENTDNNRHFTYQLPNVAAASYTYSIYAKAAERSWLAIDLTAGSNFYCWFDLQNGVLGTVNASRTASITDVGNGWYRCTVTASSLSGPVYTATFISTADNVVSYTGDGTSGIYIWGADLRPASQATGLIGPTYQRVAAATVYDTAGFLPYLAFDGLDDSMSTNSIDFSAGDKMTVWAGYRIVSGTGSQNIAEFTGNAFATNGGFSVGQGPVAATSGLGFLMNTGAGIGGQTADIPVPYSSVASWQFDSALSGLANEAKLRRNQVAQTYASTAGTDSGTGNFANAPLYLGARLGTSVYLNGWLTSLIVRGAQSTQSQIEATEAWVNGKTGAY